MLRSYFVIAIRNLVRHKVFSFINLFGLALGMSGALLIGLWVQDELKFNRFYPDLDRLYFVRMFDGNYTGDLTSSPLTEALKADIPEVEKATKLSWSQDLLVTVGKKAFKETGYYASADFFDVFQLPVVQGNPRTALQSLTTIVITRKLAEKYFGSSDVVGKTIRLDNAKDYLVGAVVDNVPFHASVQFDWIVNFKVFEEDWMNNWNNNSFQTYVKLRPKVTAAQAEHTMRTLVSRYNPGPDSKNLRPILQPLSQVHLYSEYEQGKPVGGRIEYLQLFTLIAVFTLLIACVNFMNLSTARSAARSREVGVRKVIGAGRSALVQQFVGESLLMALLALLVSLVITWLALPHVNNFTQKQLSLPLAQPALWLALLGLAVFTGLIAGSYPALFLSSLQPVRVLKGALKTGVSAARLRQALVVFQFILSTFLIVGMLVVGRQIDYLRTTRLGLDRENIFYVPIEGNLANKRKVFQQELLRSDAVQAVTTTGELPINIGSNTSGNLSWPGKDPKQIETIWQMTAGTGFVKTMNIKLLSGRDFRAIPNDSLHILVNESAAKLMGFQDPVGQPITFMGQKGRIIGLMKDFHLASLHVPIQPLVIRHISNWTNFVLVKTQPGHTIEAIKTAGEIAHQLNPAYPFEYHFLDDDYEKLYRNEMLIHTIVNVFGVVAIFISCLGLFGLVTYTAEQRTKEIGIRKVLGASVANIIALLSADFLKLVLLANLIAWPLAWWAVDRWLQNFTYRAAVSWELFVLASVAAILIALFTVSLQAIKAAIANPVKALRNE